jgi:sugar/nucleoside kinase (ribokinase family)
VPSDSPSLDAVVVGHAIVDVLAPTPDERVRELGLDIGTMTLVDGSEMARLYASIEPQAQVSGGSAANTAVCLSAFGGSARFVGRVADDHLGWIFTEDIRAAGVEFDPPPAGPGDQASGRCLVLVAPDGEKTMCTDLGAGALLGPADVPLEEVSRARVLYMEGYVWGPQPTTAAVEVALAAARRGGTKVAFSASDPGWVALQGPALRDLLGRSDLLFSNEPEALALADRDSVEGAVSWLLERCPTVVVTLGAEGCLVADRTGPRIRVPAAPVDKVIDTTGAGDSFAGGFLYGLARGMDLEGCARLGALAAAEVVSHLGARPQRSLREQADLAGLA